LRNRERSERLKSSSNFRMEPLLKGRSERSHASISAAA
jgi:hypothetical protein